MSDAGKALVDGVLGELGLKGIPVAYFDANICPQCGGLGGYSVPIPKLEGSPELDGFERFQPCACPTGKALYSTVIEWEGMSMNELISENEELWQTWVDVGGPSTEKSGNPLSPTQRTVALAAEYSDGRLLQAYQKARDSGSDPEGLALAELYFKRKTG
jgi:hypothetical protein